MECFTYKDGCGVHEHCTHIKAFKRRAGLLIWATDKQLWVISNIMLFKTVTPLSN